MADPSFVIDAWGEPLGAGVTGARYCAVGGVGKFNSEKSPYAVTNEFIAGRLAMQIGLPTPPGLIASDKGSLAYVALRFGPSGRRPEPANWDDLMVDHPGIAAGIVAFDCWIDNRDRHEENIAYSRNGQPPMAFDHERALLGVEPVRAMNLGSLAKQAWPGHALARQLRDAGPFWEWMDRIRHVPFSFIKRTCDEAMDHGALSARQYAEVLTFLQVRQSSLRKQLENALRLVDWRVL